jgi:hypothetical protein
LGIGNQLALCKRYYQQVGYFGIATYGAASASWNVPQKFEVEMRANPTATNGTYVVLNCANPPTLTVQDTKSYSLTTLVTALGHATATLTSTIEFAADL